MIPLGKFPENTDYLKTCLKMQLMINENLFAHISALRTQIKKLEDNQEHLWEATFDETPTGLGLDGEKRWEI